MQLMNWFSKRFSEATPPQSAAYDADALIIDLRTPSEFALGHVEGALNLPIDKLGQNYATVVPDKARQIVVYCQSGAQSAIAAQFFKLQRYANVINGGSAGDVARQLSSRMVQL
jgi:phage shock protein E